MLPFLFHISCTCKISLHTVRNLLINVVIVFNQLTWEVFISCHVIGHCCRPMGDDGWVIRTEWDQRGWHQYPLSPPPSPSTSSSSSSLLPSDQRQLYSRFFLASLHSFESGFWHVSSSLFTSHTDWVTETRRRRLKVWMPRNDDAFDMVSYSSLFRHICDLAAVSPPVFLCVA